MNNKVDTVQMVRQIRDQNYEKLKDKSHEEIISFFKEKSKELLSEVKNKTVTHST